VFSSDGLHPVGRGYGGKEQSNWQHRASG
jgi:hypothetical protein